MDLALQWTGFNLFVLLLLGIDLVSTRAQDGPMTMRQALTRSLFWILLGLGVNVWIYYQMGTHTAMDYLSAYLLEKSLSVDNLFVFLIIFRIFKVPEACQQRVLLFGVLGALLMRGALIFVGIGLVHRFHWILYLFGAILVFTGIKMFLSDNEGDVDPENWVVRWCRQRFALHPHYVEQKFWVKLDGKWLMTPLFIVLVAVETTDLIFALDSIPAVFAVSQNTFVVYASNIMAILGLRALFFALAGMMNMFHYLQIGLSCILIFIGSEMLLSHYLHISTPVELSVIAGILALSVGASLALPQAKETKTDPERNPESLETKG